MDGRKGTSPSFPVPLTELCVSKFKFIQCQQQKRRVLSVIMEKHRDVHQQEVLETSKSPMGHFTNGETEEPPTPTKKEVHEQTGPIDLEPYGMPFQLLSLSPSLDLPIPPPEASVWPRYPLD